MKLCFLVLFVISFQGFSQQSLSERDYALKYKKAVQLYAEQKFPEAQDELTPLTHRKYDNPMVPYVHYYHALCSFKLQKYFDARIVLRQLMERYPDWKQIEEAYYLYGNVCLADNYFDEGIENLEKITLVSLKNDAQNLEYYYFKPIKDFAQLKQLNVRHPTNQLIASLLVNMIQANKHPSRDDLELSDRLTNQFGLGISKKNSPTSKYDTDSQKDNLNIAVLLPFRVSDFDPAKRTRPNQYIFEIYEGMKLAKEKLAAERINVNLYAFDIDKNADDMLDLVNNAKFSKMDMFVGPLYPEANRIATSFAQDKKIVQVHPLSNNSQLIQKEPLTFLASPSYEMQAKKTIEFMLNQNPSRTVAIYFGNSRKDSTFAYIYRDVAMERGLDIKTIKKFTSEEVIDTKNKVGHIFFAGSGDNIGAKIITALDKKKVVAPMVATSAAFDFETTSLAIFNHQLYLIQPDFIDQTKEEVKNFRSSYINEQNMIPSYYSYWGYDMTLFFGRMLSAGKKNLRNQMDNIEYTQGYTLAGFDYTNGANENQIVPIIKYQDGKFVEVSR